MSGITGQEDISHSKETLVSSTGQVHGTKSIVFAHEATGGETVLDLSALVPPDSMSSNGFSNPSPSEIAAANLLVFRKSLTLQSSVRGVLVDLDSYKIVGPLMISFIGNMSTGLLPGEIIYGRIHNVQRTGSLIADGKYQRITYELPVGQTVVPVGIPFKINQNSAFQGSSIRVYRNGVRVVRNINNAPASVLADGNYHEIDAGGGYGTSIQFNVPPALTPDVIDIDLGLYVTDGSTEIFSSLERLAGTMYAMAQDLAAATGNPVGNYLAASLSEIERATYAAMVLSNTSRIEVLESIPQLVRASSSNYVPTLSGRFYPIPNAVMTLPEGEWLVFGTAFFTSPSVTAGYTRIYSLWSSDQVVTESTLPVGGLAVDGGNVYSTIFVPSSPENIIPASSVKVSVLSGIKTVCLNVLADMATPANARISTNIWAQRVG